MSMSNVHVRAHVAALSNAARTSISSCSAILRYNRMLRRYIVKPRTCGATGSHTNAHNACSDTRPSVSSQCRSSNEWSTRAAPFGRVASSSSRSAASLDTRSSSSLALAPESTKSHEACTVWRAAMHAARDLPLGLIMTPTVPLCPLVTAVVRVRRPRAAAWMREAASARESLKSAENHIFSVPYVCDTTSDRQQVYMTVACRQKRKHRRGACELACARAQTLASAPSPRT